MNSIVALPSLWRAWWAHTFRWDHSPSSLRYRSRDIPAVRRLFLMMKIGTAAYFGITTGRMTPALGITMWSPSMRTQENQLLEDLDQLFIGDRPQLRHASAEAGV